MLVTAAPFLAPRLGAVLRAGVTAPVVVYVCEWLEESLGSIAELLPRHTAGIRDEDGGRILQVGCSNLPD